jgi:hypothetical protein
VLGGAAASVGVLGFVTLVGGAVAEAQLSGAGLPATRALAELPRTDLLVVGARLLTPFAAILGLQLLIIRGSEDKTPRPRLRMATVAALSGAGLILNMAEAHAERAPLLVWLVGVAVTILVITTLTYARDWSYARFVADVIAAILATVCGGYALTFAEPDVRPVAVVLKGGHAVVGIYAAANSNDVVVGEVCTTDTDARRGDVSTGSIVIVPRDSVTALAIGTNGSLGAAINKEAQLLSLISPAASAQSTKPRPPRRVGDGGPSPQGGICTDRVTATSLPTRADGSFLLGP